MKYRGHDIPSLRHIINRFNEYTSLIPEEENISRAFLIYDYIKSFLIYGCGTMDYFLYSFYNLNGHGKKKFFTVKQRVLFDHKHNLPEGIDLVLDKEKALTHFERFINRDWCGQRYHNRQEDYKAFEGKHERAIVKPINSMGGSGVQIISLHDIHEEGYTLYEYCKKHRLLVEALIPQHEKMNKMYSTSVNTVRLVTVNGKCIGACLRIGTGGSNIDNAHAGGIFAEIDIESGIVISKAVNHRMKQFIYHPDTGTVIPGFEIPQWDKVIELIQDASEIIPEVSLIGWDIAISSVGPTLVEVNHMPGMELIQVPNQHGVRYLIENETKK